jgi:hypothetical protein
MAVEAIKKKEEFSSNHAINGRTTLAHNDS